MNAFYSNLFPALTPHLIVVFAVVVAALWNLFSPNKRFVTPVVSFLALVLASISYVGQIDVPTARLFEGLYTVDRFSIAFGLISCIVSAIVVLMTMGYESKFGPNRGEYYAILLTATLSVMFLGGTTDLIMLFVALETLTICCVLLSGMIKLDLKSNEA